MTSVAVALAQWAADLEPGPGDLELADRSLIDTVAVTLAARGQPGHPVVAGLPDLLAEVVLAARSEQARSVGDVLLRRTRLGLLAARELPGDPVRRVAEVLARELEWDAARIGVEIDRFAEEAAAEGLVGA